MTSGKKTGTITMTTSKSTISLVADPTDLAPVFDAFLAALRLRDSSEFTITAYRRDLVQFARWFTDSLDQPFTVMAVTPTDVRDFRSYLRDRLNQKPASINRKLAALRSFFRWATLAELRLDSPVATVKDVREERQAPRWFLKRDVDRLLREIEANAKPSTRARDLAIVQVLRHTGLRVGELVRIRLRDLTLSDRKGAVRVFGKGAKERMVPLNQTVRAALAVYLAVRRHRPEAELFLGQRGPLAAHAVEKIVRKYALRAALEDFSPHSLRHSFAKRLLDAGEDLVTVKTLLGHERLDTTARYTHPGALDLEEAVGKLDDEA
jgi:integrase/recombinase XerC